QCRPAIADPRVQTGTVQHRHPEIAHDEVVGSALEERQRLRPIGSDIDRVADSLQHRGHQLTNGRVIVDHKHSRHNGAKFVRLATSLPTRPLSGRLLGPPAPRDREDRTSSRRAVPWVGFIVTTPTGTNRAIVRFYNQRGTAEQWIKEGKAATHWTRLS